MLVQEYLLNKKKNCLRCKDKTEKSHDVIRQLRLHMSKYKINEDLQSIMANLPPNCCLNVDFQSGKHTGGKWLINNAKRRNDNQLQSLKLPWITKSVMHSW